MKRARIRYIDGHAESQIYYESFEEDGNLIKFRGCLDGVCDYNNPSEENGNWTMVDGNKYTFIIMVSQVRSIAVWE